MDNSNKRFLGKFNNIIFLILLLVFAAVAIFFAYRAYVNVANDSLPLDDPYNIPAYVEVSPEINEVIDLWDNAANAKAAIPEEERSSFFGQFNDDESTLFDQYIGTKTAKDMSVEISSTEEITETDLSNLRALFQRVIDRTGDYPADYDMNSFVALVRLKAQFMRELFQSALLSYDRKEYFATKNFKVMVTTTSILGYRDPYLMWKEAAVFTAAIKNQDFYMKDPGVKAEFSRELLEKKIVEADVTLANIERLEEVFAEYKTE